MLASIQGGDGAPPEPDWTRIYTDDLDVAAAREAWGVLVREMREAGTLAVGNGDAIARLVRFRLVFDRAGNNVAEVGAVLPPKGRRMAQYNPQWTVMKQADEAIRSLEAELGISPLRRAKVGKVSRGKKASSAADSYLGPRKTA